MLPAPLLEGRDANVQAIGGGVHGQVAVIEQCVVVQNRSILQLCSLLTINVHFRTCSDACANIDGLRNGAIHWRGPSKGQNPTSAGWPHSVEQVLYSLKHRLLIRL